MYQDLNFTYHARKRMQQRGVTEHLVRYVIDHGQWIQRAGALHCVLRKKDIPREDRRSEQFRRLEGTTVLINSDEEPPLVLTVYRNRDSVRKIFHKTKKDLKKWYCTSTDFSTPLIHSEEIQ